MLTELMRNLNPNHLFLTRNVFICMETHLLIFLFTRLPGLLFPYYLTRGVQICPLFSVLLVLLLVTNRVVVIDFG